MVSKICIDSTDKTKPIDEKETMTNKMHILTAEHGNNNSSNPLKLSKFKELSKDSSLQLQDARK